MKTDGIIFDVDGTLWNSTGIVAGAWTEAVREEGCPDKTVLPEQLQALFGLPMDVIADRLLPELTPEHRSRIMDKCVIYEQKALKEDPCRICYPGVAETIRALCEELPLFIVSNCQAGYIELFLEKTGLGDCIRDFECFGNNGRKKAENLRALIRRNALLMPVYVGDTQGDAEASEEAGVPFIFAGYGFGSADRFAEKITAFSELKALFLEKESV